MVLLYWAKLLSTHKPRQITNLAKSCSSFNTLCPIQISCEFIHYNILPLNFQYSNNSLPENISNLFLYPTQVLIYNTRFSEIANLNIKYSRTNHLKHSFSMFGARIWNSIPQSIRILPKHKFKDSLHQLRLRILELEDTYVDTPTLVNKLSKLTV